MENKTGTWNCFSNRAWLAVILIQLCFFSLLIRVVYIEAIYGDQIRERAYIVQPEQGEAKIKRGKIVDRNGEILAINRNLISVWADPSFLKVSPQKAARQLAPIVGKSESTLIGQLSEKNKRFVWIQRNIPYSQLKAIRSMTQKIQGVNFQLNSKRVYPNGRLACHVVGITSFDGHGIDGIEHQYDPYLLPASQSDAHIKDQIESIDNSDVGISPINPGYPLSAEPLTQGHTIELTIDRYLQHLTEQVLADGCQKWKAKSGTAIVMKPKTGELLAMANYPSYDLNQYAESPEAYKRNVAMWMQYEPGSVFKIVTACGVINEKIASAETTEYCEMGAYQLPNGHVIKDVRPNGWLSLSEIIQKSSNIGIIKTAEKLGHGSMSSYVEAFGFGEKTGIDLPFERKGSLRGLRVWDEYAKATVPFGQGISVTPLQMLNSINTIATKGVLIKPNIVGSILTDGLIIGEVKRFHPRPIRRVMSPETASKLTKILVQVTEQGSGKNAQVDGYQVAGKTGTSQKAIAGQGYVEGKVVVSFAGFLPADAPLISIIVVIDEPFGAPLSTEVTAPMFQEIAGQAMSYMSQKYNLRKEVELAVHR